jgi:hypothetical protein
MGDKLSFWLVVAGQAFTCLGALLALIQGIRNHRAISSVHVSLNSRLSELLDSSKKASFAEGHAQGVESERAVPKEH